LPQSYNQSLYDKNKQKIGDLTGLIIERDARIRSGMVGVGHFLGVRRKQVEVPT
jgi:hypothetical protein